MNAKEEIVKVGASFRKASDLVPHSEEPKVKVEALDHWQIEIERNNTQIDAIRKNTSLTVDQQLQAINALEATNQKLETERRKDIFNQAIQHNRPQFEALKNWFEGKGIPPAFSTPESVVILLEMRKQIEAKAQEAKGCYDDVNVRLKELQTLRTNIKAKWDEVESKRKEAEDFEVRTKEQVRKVNEEMLDCAKDMFEINPAYVVLSMPDIANILMGEAQVNSTPQAPPIAQTSPANQSTTGTAVGAVNFQTVNGIQIATRRAMTSKDNPHHTAMLNALTLENVKKAVEVGKANPSSNIECLAWIGKNIVGLTEVVIDQGLNSKISLLRQALNYPKG